MLLHPAEFTHASDRFEFTTKAFGASGAGRSLHRCRCPYHFVGWVAVANQLAAAWMWLAGTMPLSTVHSNSLLYFSVILRNPWFSLGNNKCFWKENEKLYWENYWQCFWRRWVISFNMLMSFYHWDWRVLTRVPASLLAFHITHHSTQAREPNQVSEPGKWTSNFKCDFYS